MADVTHQRLQPSGYACEKKGVSWSSLFYFQKYTNSFFLVLTVRLKCNQEFLNLCPIQRLVILKMVDGGTHPGPSSLPYTALLIEPTNFGIWMAWRRNLWQANIKILNVLIFVKSCSKWIVSCHTLLFSSFVQSLNGNFYTRTKWSQNSHFSTNNWKNVVPDNINSW